MPTKKTESSHASAVCTINVLFLVLFLLSACAEDPCADGPEIPPSLVSAGVLAGDASTCPFGSATDIRRWPNIGYVKVSHGDALADVVTRYDNRMTTMGWERVECNEDLAGKSVDGIAQCYLTRQRLVRYEFYELDNTMIDVDLYNVEN